MGIPQMIWFIKGKPNQMDDLWVPPFQETSIYSTQFGRISMYFGIHFAGTTFRRPMHSGAEFSNCVFVKNTYWKGVAIDKYGSNLAHIRRQSSWNRVFSHLSHAVIL